MKVEPTWQEAFRGELINNLRRVSNDFSRQLFIIDIAKECVMYSCDMCLHYYKQGAYKGISSERIDDISYNVCVAMNSVVKEFTPNNWEEVQSKVRTLLMDESTYDILQTEINKYYHS